MKKNVLLTVVLALFAWAGMLAGTSTGVFISQNCDPRSNYTPDRFAEIYNPTDEVVDLSGWTLENVQAGNVQFVWILSGTINSGEALVCGNEAVTDRTITPDFTSTWSGNSWNGKGIDGTILKNPNGDTIDYAVQDDATGKFDNAQMVRNASVVTPTKIYDASEWSFSSVTNATDENATVGIHVCDLPVQENPIPTITDILPVSGTDFLEEETFTISATVTTTDAAGIDSVCLAYGGAMDALNDTVKMVADADTFFIPFAIEDAGSYYGKIIAFGGNGTTATSSFIEVLVMNYNDIDMLKSYYQIIVDTVNARGMNTHQYAANSEDYYGASAYNVNFDVRDGKYDSDFITADSAIEVALSTVLLPAIRSNAAVNDTFLVNYAVYDGSATSEDIMPFVCSETSPLTFVKLLEAMDVTAPEWAEGYPYADNITGNSFDITFKASENAMTYAALYDTLPDIVPTKEEIMARVIADDEAGMIPVSTTEFTMTLDELMPEQTYYLYFYMTDDAGNEGNVMMVSVTTLEGTSFPTFTMDSMDYQIIIDTVNARGLNTDSYPETSEDYYGASAYYSNFAGRDGDFSSDFASNETAVSAAISTILLPAKFPTAAVDDTFKVSFVLYDGSDNDLSYTFVCSSASPLAFTYLPEEKIELISFTAFSQISLTEDMHLVDLSALRASGLLPDSIELFTTDNSFKFKIRSWGEGDAPYDGTSQALYALTPEFNLPYGYEINSSVVLSGTQKVLVASIQSVATSVDSLMVDFQDEAADLGQFSNVQLSGETTWVLDGYGDNGYAYIGTFGVEVETEAWLVSKVGVHITPSMAFSFDVTSYNSEKTIADCEANHFEVYYSTAYDGEGIINASQWTRIADVDAVMLAARWDFVSFSTTLSDLEGEVVYVAFRHKDAGTGAGTTWEVDNVALKPLLTSSINNNKIAEFAVYPNPANSIISLLKAVDRLEVISLSGQNIISVSNVAANQGIDVSRLNNGVYFVKYTVSGESQVTKFIKK